MSERLWKAEDEFYRKHSDAYVPYEKKSRNFADFYEENYHQLMQCMKRNGLVKGSRVLTVGIGPGNRDTELLLAEGASLYGFDVSEKALRLCRTRFPEVILTKCSGHELPFKEESFDFVCFILVVHHMTGQVLRNLPKVLAEYAVAEAFRVLQKGGKIVCLEPNVLYPSTCAIYPINSVMQRIKPGWRGMVPTERNISPFRLRELLLRHGFSQIQYHATTLANSKMPRPIFLWLRRRESRLREHAIFKHFGVFTLIYGEKPRS